MKTDPEFYDVIIVGAGPVGLFLACELALAKCSVLVLERAVDPTSTFKSVPFGIRGLSSPTIEALDRRGLLTELELHREMKNPHQDNKQPRAQGGHFAGIPFLESDVDVPRWKFRLPSSPPTNLISEMRELESIFSRRAGALMVEIRRGFEVTEIHQEENGIHVRAGDQLFRAAWLVGCDGARSMTRKSGGFEFVGTEPDFTGYSTLVDIADPEKLRPGRNVTPNGMYMQSRPGYILMQDFDGGDFHRSEKPITLEHVQEVLRRVSRTDVTVTALHAATRWTDRARQATTYRQGRILLAGDAAHIHSPLGGQGLNLGLGDAMNLGWKLAATIRGEAADGLLDTYEQERHPVGERVLDWSRAQVAVMKPGPEGRALNAIFRDLIATRDGATYFASRVWGVHTQYDLGGANSLIGHSVPNFEFENGGTVSERMREGHGLLLDFTGTESLADAALGMGDLIKYVAGVPQETLGVKAALVRPDGIVAWATESAPEADSVAKAYARWLRPRHNIRKSD